MVRLALLVLIPLGLQAELPLLSAKPWEMKGSVEKGKDLSGIIVSKAMQGYIVSDETRFAQAIELQPQQRSIAVKHSLVLREGDGSELDLEAATGTEDGTITYFIGSHAVARKTGAKQPDRYHIYQITRRAEGKITGVSESTLRPLLERSEQLSAVLDRPAVEAGLDIEGLAERDGQLFVGFRSPTQEGRAWVLQIAAADVFPVLKDEVKPVLHALDLGRARGIRDMQKFGAGFLVIAGPMSSEADALGFTLHYWAGPGTDAAPALGRIPAPEGGKAEALAVLPEADATRRALILFDGVKEGGVIELEIPAIP
jgi:hypothetical protein